MNIKKYEDYFHDGSVDRIQQNDDRIELFMESCEIIPEWNDIDLSLSKSNTIVGKLILSGVKKIIVDDEIVKEINQTHDDAGILQFDIYGEHVDLIVEWFNNPPKERIWKCEHIVIYARKIEWENIPDLLDSF